MITAEQKEKLETALRLMIERRHEVAGLGAPIMLIRDVLGHFEPQCAYRLTDACDCGAGPCMYSRSTATLRLP